jgi:hypothetical protein
MFKLILYSLKIYARKNLVSNANDEIEGMATFTTLMNISLMQRKLARLGKTVLQSDTTAAYEPHTPRLVTSSKSLSYTTILLVQEDNGICQA